MGHIDIKKLTLDELIGVVNIYPWYGAAQKELCDRMYRMSGDGWGEAQLAEAALYIGDREKLSAMVRASKQTTLSDSDVEKILKSYISDKAETDEKTRETKPRKVHVVGGDYFSQADYEAVKASGNIPFSNYIPKARQEKNESHANDQEIVVYTETLAQIYLEQGYPEQAKRIYSKLILAYPEKNAYFAALIAKIENEIINQ